MDELIDLQCLQVIADDLEKRSHEKWQSILVPVDEMKCFVKSVRAAHELKGENESLREQLKDSVGQLEDIRSLIGAPDGHLSVYHFVAELKEQLRTARADATRLDYLLRYMRIDDVGDDQTMYGLAINNEELEESIGAVDCYDTVRDAIDKAIRALGDAEPQKG